MEHPAKFSDEILGVLTNVLADESERQDRLIMLLDPFAGTGRIHELDDDKFIHTWGVELEPEWANMHGRTIIGDATKLVFGTEIFDAIVTSPCYGNRMADTYDGRDGSKRHTYRIALGRPTSEGSAASMQWGPQYRELHEKAIDEMIRVVRPGGLI